MRAIILAAGRGSRMGGLTADQPKCLTRLHEKALIEWQLAALDAAGASEVALVTGYRGEALARFADSRFVNPRWAETNMVRSLFSAADWLQHHACLVSYSDIVYHPDIVRRLLGATSDIAISYDTAWRALWEARFGDPLLDAESFRLEGEGRLLEIGGRPDSIAAIQGQYMGLFAIRPPAWREIERLGAELEPAALDALDVTGLLRHLLSRGVEIEALPIDGRWCEVDSESDLALCQARTREPGRWTHDWRW